ncbi:BBE domain-containing protein [Embleya sp. AB8]|uniref:BBE domain-containing protein n=1 Tax=Embleya sp. AB8 TaxID=3156304 RepID=UPI003C741CCF
MRVPVVDPAEPVWNTSGTAWHTLYYRDGYPRLQRVQARRDPRDVFRYTPAVDPPHDPPRSARAYLT